MTDNDTRTSSSSDRLVIGFAAGCMGILLIGAVFTVGFGVGFGVGRISAPSNPTWYRSADTSRAMHGSAHESTSASENRLYPEFSLFWEAMDLLYADYYGQLPPSDEVVDEAIRGVLQLLDDPNTSYFTPEEADYYRDNLNGEFEGIGARVGWDAEADSPVIVESFQGQPAWNAGLRRDDLIIAVDGASMVGRGLDEAVALVRGPKGATVVLTIQDAETSQVYDVAVVRDRIDVPTVSSRALGDDADIAYFRLTSFNENAGSLLRESVQNAMLRQPKALILDLRGNSGGLLREAVAVASIFLDGGSDDTVILYEQFKNGETNTYTTEGEPVASDLPMVVLVNESSASASEIVAGALQDHGRALLIGAATFGKGSVQLPHTLSNDGIMRVTVAHWLTPDRRSINATGLVPDIIIESSAGEPSSDIDPQLQSALDFIHKTIAAADK